MILRQSRCCFHQPSVILGQPGVDLDTSRVRRLHEAYIVIAVAARLVLLLDCQIHAPHAVLLPLAQAFRQRPLARQQVEVQVEVVALGLGA